jgi:hypothetical protein
MDPTAIPSIDAWRSEVGAPNLRAAIVLDTRSPDWLVQRIDAVLCCNMIHISPWNSAVGLFEGVGEVLEPAGVLVLYGPFRFSGSFTAPSNARFDASLRSRDPEWGIRDCDDVTALAKKRGLALMETIPMPANNHCLVFGRAAGCIE